MTEPGFIARTSSRLTSFGAAAPGTSTAPITRSAATTSRSIVSTVENSVYGEPNCEVELVKARQGAVEDRDVRLHPHRDARRVGAGNPAAEDQHLGRRHAGHAAEENAHAALFLLQAVGADLHRHPPGHLAHRRESGRPPVLSVTVS